MLVCPRDGFSFAAREIKGLYRTTKLRASILCLLLGHVGPRCSCSGPKILHKHMERRHTHASSTRTPAFVDAAAHSNALRVQCLRSTLRYNISVGSWVAAHELREFFVTTSEVCVFCVTKQEQGEETQWWPSACRWGKRTCFLDKSVAVPHHAGVAPNMHVALVWSFWVKLVAFSSVSTCLLRCLSLHRELAELPILLPRSGQARGPATALFLGVKRDSGGWQGGSTQLDGRASGASEGRPQESRRSDDGTGTLDPHDLDWKACILSVDGEAEQQDIDGAVSLFSYARNRSAKLAENVTEAWSLRMSGPKAFVCEFW